MNLDLWDIDDSILFKKQFAASDPHDPIFYDDYLEDYHMSNEDIDDNDTEDTEDEGIDEFPAETDPFDWFNEREPKEYDV